MEARTEDIESSIQHKLASLRESVSTLCIYKVPEHIRKVNRECYQPSIVSIGPIYHKKSSLKCSQELKLRHLECFLEFGSQIYGDDQAYTLGEYIDIIKHWEDEARSYYEDKISLSSNEFVEMMMVDSAFIICYIMFHSDQFSLRINPMEKKTVWMVKVEQDLFLEDNQLPFFVINKLYGIAFGRAYTDISFKDLTCNFISQTYIPGREAARIVGREKVSDASYIKHLVDFLRICCLPPERNQNQEIVITQQRMCMCCLPSKHKNQNSDDLDHNNEDSDQFPPSANQEIVISKQRMCCLPPKHKNRNSDDLDHNNEDSDQFPPSAKELKAAGIKFKATDGKNLLDIKYENGVLQIPTLTIQDTTESILRSLIFFEQCHHFSDSYFTDYVFFLDALIDTPEDVQILVQRGIIKHWLGSDDEVATMVNRMTRYITIYTPNFYYSNICRKLNKHAGTRWNKWRAILKRDYFNHPWSVLSVIYLVLLLILTVLQVYTGFRGLG